MTTISVELPELVQQALNRTPNEMKSFTALPLLIPPILGGLDHDNRLAA